jgi:hypothetical protein
MYRIAVNTAISFARSSRRRQQPLVPLDAELTAGLLAAPEPDELWELRQAIEELDSFDKALVLLTLEGHPHEVIGEILGISTSNNEFGFLMRSMEQVDGCGWTVIHPPSRMSRVRAPSHAPHQNA